MSERVIELAGVTKDYGAGEALTRVLRGIDLTIDAGELAALIGPSGSGKSTLLNIIGLLDRPTEGEVRVGGRDTAALGDDERTHLRARTLGFVFQFHHLLPALSALENTRMPLVMTTGRVERWMDERALTLLERVGLSPRARARAGTLSGGEQQRVAIARALAMRPPLVLADEPTGNLDTETSTRVFALLREINRDEKTAFLIVTHDPSIAAQCERVIELVDGRVRSDTRR